MTKGYMHIGVLSKLVYSAPNNFYENNDCKIW